jgi:formylglycine-generating enzyme required for sulfatase activity
VLREWGQQEQLRKIDHGEPGALAPGGEQGRASAPSKRRWYVNGQGQTMVVIPPPGEFCVGEDEGPHRRRIDRSFALATRAVTIEEFLRFRGGQEPDMIFAPKSDCPMNDLSWYDAAAYCNWLSKQEEIPEDQWCYAPNEKGEYAAGMRVVAGYLGKTGYRLPTEAEREYACRAGSETPWYFGAGRDLLGKYAWFSGNSVDQSHPVGTLRPNDLGMFDLHGNVNEWCQDSYIEWPPQAGPAFAASAVGSQLSPLGPGLFTMTPTMRARPERVPSLMPSLRGAPAIDDNEDMKYISDSNVRLLRGGMFLSGTAAVRSAGRSGNSPANRDFPFGFRPARTFR